ncbi:MAG: tRNA (adenosine(37)-N6)-threonylcarbamoyltransferase complex transferase subunit TsaD [Patescibacteria group bacterium]
MFLWYNSLGMRILAIESSCDDTAVAVVEGTRPKASLRERLKVLVSLVASQEKLHAEFGGVVPEVASRQHLEAIYPLIELALRKTGLAPKQIDAIAVTTDPGLLGSLLVGVNAAKTLGYLWDKPVISVNHLLGHIYAGWLGDEKIEYPLVSLVTSGGHSEIVLTRSDGEYKYVGGTRDDAAGEAFDKVARILGLGYPGGPAIAAEAAKLKVKSEKLKTKEGEVRLPRPMMDEDNFDFSFSGLKTAIAAAAANIQYPITNNQTILNHQAPSTKAGERVRLPRPMMDEDNFDFSFSGLKTATAAVAANIQYPITNNQAITKKRIAEIAWEFQEAVVEVLVVKLLKAAKKYKAKTIIIGGGVSANRRLREEVQRRANELGLKIVIPEFKYCTDNAAMIGAAAYFTMREERGVSSPHRRLAKPILANARTSRLLPTPPVGKQTLTTLPPSFEQEKYRWYNANVITD